MQGPAWEKTAQRYIRCPASKPERLSRGALPHFPDKSVVIKMEQGGSGDYAGEDAFDDVYSEMRIEIRERAIGENQADIEPHQRAAASKHKAHESADVAVFFHAVAIVDPDQREVLHVVENFVQRKANKNVCHQIVAVPPKRDAGDQQSYLHGIRPFAYDPHAAEMDEKEDRNCNGRPQNKLLAVV